MKTVLRWKKNIFSSTYKIYSDEKLVGKLKDKSFSQSADGALTGEHFGFKTRGFFKQNTTIVDKKDNTVIGKISYNNWMTKATIKTKNKKSVWKYDNLWNTKWSIYDSDGIMIKYTGTATSGLIHSNTEDALFLLSGLYVTNYYRQATVAIIIAVFIPIWLAIMN
jgi:hypothetical protein